MSREQKQRSYRVDESSEESSDAAQRQKTPANDAGAPDKKRPAFIDVESLRQLQPLFDERKRIRLTTLSTVLDSDESDSDSERSDDDKDDSTFGDSFSDHSSDDDDSDDGRQAQRMPIKVAMEPSASDSDSQSSSSSSSSDESNTDTTDYDICRARYHLLYNKERGGGALAPEALDLYERQLNDSVWGPLTARSFDLEGADRDQVFSDYARVALDALLPFQAPKKSVQRLTKVLRF